MAAGGIDINTLSQPMSPSDTVLRVAMNGELTPVGRRFGVRIGGEVMEVTDNSTTTWRVNRAQNGTRAEAHAAGNAIQMATLAAAPPSGTPTPPTSPAARLSATLQFFPNRPDTDVVPGPGLVLQPGNPRSVSKVCTVQVRGWGQGQVPVEVLILSPAGGRILITPSIPVNLPNDLLVFPGEGYTPDVVSTDTPSNMDLITNSGERPYGFSLNFSAGPSGPSATPLLILVRQRGVGEVRLPLTVLVTAAASGAVSQKFQQLGGAKGLLGPPTGGEQTTPTGGRVQTFQRGAIYFHPTTGAHEVHGAILQKYAQVGADRSVLGYPTSDEQPAASGGRVSFFRGGAIYWTPQTGAHEVHGAILDRFRSLDSERGFLRFPVSDEYASGGDRRSDFQGGSITWNPRDGAVAHRV